MSSIIIKKVTSLHLTSLPMKEMIYHLKVMKSTPKMTKRRNEFALQIASGHGLLTIRLVKRKIQQFTTNAGLELIIMKNMKVPVCI